MNRDQTTLPIYQQLESLIREKMDAGEWTPGTMLPSERQLSEAHGVARMTVRQAISSLVAEGLLTRVQGRGTFVARPPLRQVLRRLTSFSEDMRERGLLASTRLLSRLELRADGSIAAALAIPEGSPVLELQRLRCADGHPVALEIATLRGDLAAPIAHEDLERHSLYRLLEERCGVRILRASQELEAAVAGEAEARHLGTDVGAPILHIRRKSLGIWQDQEVLCEYVRSAYRGDRYRFYVELER